MDITSKVTGSNLTASEFMQIVTELENAIEDTGITLSSGTLDQISKTMANYASGGAFYVDSGAADAYVCSPVGNKLGITSYADGVTVSFIVGNNNTGASTINVNGVGAKSIVDNSGYALVAGALESGDVVTIKFDNSNNYFRLIDSKFNRNPVGFKILDTKHLLTTADFPDTTGLYGWHNNATGAWADEDWNGGEALTEVGAITTDTDIFGVASTYIDFDGANDAMYSSGTAFDTADESFTAGGWFKFDRTGVAENLLSKSEGDNAGRSWFLQHTSAGEFLFRVHYNNSGGAVSINSSAAIVQDGNWHNLSVIYDQANTSIALYLDGKCIGYEVDSNLTNRNNGTTSEFCVGARYDTTGTTIDQYFDGNIEEVFYKKTALTGNEIRKVYAASCQRFVTEETSNLRGSIVSIQDGRKNNGYFKNSIQSTYTVTTSFAKVTGQGIYIPEDGVYKIITENTGVVEDADDTTSSLYVRLASTVTGRILDSNKTIQHVDDTNNKTMIVPFSITHTGYFSKDESIELQAKMDAGDNSTIRYNSDATEGFISWEKLD